MHSLAVRAATSLHPSSLGTPGRPRQATAKRTASRPGMPGSVLVPLRLERVGEEAALLEYAMRSTEGSVLIHCTGPAASSPPTPATLDLLTLCLGPSAHSMPRRDVVPLLPYLGWNPQRLAGLRCVEEVVAAAEHASECRDLLDELNTARQAAGLPSLSLTVTAGHTEAGEQHGQQAAGGGGGDPQQQQQQQQEGGSATAGAPAGEAPAGCGSRVIGDWQGPLVFNKVAVGGTFDRLHAGHRLLLAATALVTRGQIFVGITADQLLANKRNRELLEPYQDRLQAAVGYMQLVNPGADITAGPLTDPTEPPMCAFDPDFDAVVVSEETIPGAHAINQVRAQQGFPPLAIVVIGLIYSHQRDVKLSSTDLREQDAASSGGSPRR